MIAGDSASDSTAPRDSARVNTLSLCRKFEASGKPPFTKKVIIAPLKFNSIVDIMSIALYLLVLFYLKLFWYGYNR